MRKSLWIIPVLLMAIVVPHAKADSISDATTITDSTTFTFKCCNGYQLSVNDLEIVYGPKVKKAKVTPPPADTCTTTFEDNMSRTNCAVIRPGDLFTASVMPDTGTILSACWTEFRVCVASTTPTPEPATDGLMLLGIGLVFVMRKRIGQGLPQTS
jgi:hypothetical protein